MRQITQDSVNAFLAGRTMAKQNMMVDTVTLNGLATTRMWLHGNLIATLTGVDIDNCTITLRDAGWQTNTTKERLNGIIEALGLWRTEIAGAIVNGKIGSVNGQWEYADDIAWDGSCTIEIRDGVARFAS